MKIQNVLKEVIAYGVTAAPPTHYGKRHASPTHYGGVATPTTPYADAIAATAPTQQRNAWQRLIYFVLRIRPTLDAPTQSVDSVASPPSTRTAYQTLNDAYVNANRLAHSSYANRLTLYDATPNADCDYAYDSLHDTWSRVQRSPLPGISMSTSGSLFVGDSTMHTLIELE